MPLYPAVGAGIADALIEGGRALQVTEQNGQALHANFLAWGEHFGGKQVAKFLYGGDLQVRRGTGIPFEAFQNGDKYVRGAVVQPHDDTARTIREVTGSPAIVVIDQFQGLARYGCRRELCSLI